MEIVRQIDVFDNQTEKLFQEINLDSFDLELYKKRFEVKTEDPLMYDGYEITSSTVDLFPNIAFDFGKYSYFVSCYQA